MSFQDERPKERFIPNPQARLGDQVREVMRFKHYALRTEQTYDLYPRDAATGDWGAKPAGYVRALSGINEFNR